MITLITGNSNTGKTTSVTGQELYGVTGLDPKHTLIVVGSKKTLDEMSINYNSAQLSTISKNLASLSLKTVPDGPVPYNYIGVNTAADDLDLLYALIINAATFGIKYIDGKVYPILNLVVDDLQSYVNNSFYMSDLGKKDQFAKFDNVAKATLNLLDVLKSIEFDRVTKRLFAEDKRLDIFCFIHIAATNPEAPVSQYNKLNLKYAGSIMKHVYPLEGEFSSILHAEDYKFRTKRFPGHDLIRTRPGMFSDDTIPADLAIVKSAITNLYNEVKINKNE